MCSSGFSGTKENRKIWTFWCNQVIFCENIKEMSLTFKPIVVIYSTVIRTPWKTFTAVKNCDIIHHSNRHAFILFSQKFRFYSRVMLQWTVFISVLPLFSVDPLTPTGRKEASATEEYPSKTYRHIVLQTQFLQGCLLILGPAIHVTLDLRQ